MRFTFASFRPSLIGFCVIALALTTACNNSNTPTPTTQQSTTVNKPDLHVPNFNAETAYQSVAKQVSFGPRVPGTPAQKKCADWMEIELKKVCDTVYVQNTTVTNADSKPLPCINLIGVINPKAKRRILFVTHWDSRPWADMDTKDKDKPILGADDGGSGVAVLLEVANQLKANKFSADLGIDIFFNDVEDYGVDGNENSYCLGTQYWAHHPHVPGYKADFGILLDMVGASNAQFPLEGFSTQYASNIQQQVWAAANNAGYSSYFTYNRAGYITDDHVSINKITGIPTIDIINLSGGVSHSFAPHWHTHMDDMSIIDRNTLKAVGQTLLQVIYETATPSS